jgi:hypothetical protein
MGKKSQARPNGFVLFDVLYEDGTQTSNRKVPAADLGGLDGDAPARAFVEAQDRDIGAVSGRPRGRIKSIGRSRSATNKGAPAEARRAPRNQSFGR